MPFRVTSEPVNLPLDMGELRAHLDIETSERDAYLETLLRAAAKTVERWEWRALITQTILLTLDEFPDVIYVPRPRLQSVTSIKYIDSDGNQQTLDSSVYQVDTYSEPGRIMPAYLQSWPTLRGSDLAAVEVTVVAGYGDDESAIPEDTKHLLKLLVSHFWNNPAAVSDLRVEELPVGIDALLRPCHDDRVLEMV